jgi:hypothetical protein
MPRSKFLSIMRYETMVDTVVRCKHGNSYVQIPDEFDDIKVFEVETCGCKEEFRKITSSRVDCCWWHTGTATAARKAAAAALHRASDRIERMFSDRQYYVDNVMRATVDANVAAAAAKDAAAADTAANDPDADASRIAAAYAAADAKHVAGILDEILAIDAADARTDADDSTDEDDDPYEDDDATDEDDDATDEDDDPYEDDDATDEDDDATDEDDDAYYEDDEDTYEDDEDTDEDDNAEKCSICFDRKDKVLVRTKCNHVFCTVCINSWTQQKKTNTCPTCRGNLRA